MDNQQSYRKRIVFIGAVFTAIALGIISNLAYWQLIDPKDYTEKQIGDTPMPAKRGTIFDSTGHILATDIIEYSVGISPNVLKNDKIRENLAGELSPKLAIPQLQILEMISDTTQSYVSLNQAPISLSVATQIKKMRNGSAIRLDPRYRRVYPEQTLAANVIGLANRSESKDTPLRRAGITGVEGYYDDILEGIIGSHGQNGFQWDTLTGQSSMKEPISGNDIYLTINRAAQNIVETELAKAQQQYGAKEARAIVMDPRTGAILAMADTQTYNPNLREASGNFSNKNISWIYEPGSVFKIFTMASALDSGKIGPATTVKDTGSYIVDANHIIPNSDEQAHGVVDVTTILAKSLNVPTIQIAEVAGAETFYNYVNRFGLKERTGIDLENEALGSFSIYGEEGWYESDLAYNAIGQGVLITPIQLITAIAAVANHGLMMQPHVVDKIVTNHGETIQPIEATPIRNVIRADTADVLTHILANAIEQSNSAAQISGYRIAGKTGTAEFIDPETGTYDKTRSIATFAGYFPIDDPQLVILVILSQPSSSKWASHTAAPTFSVIGTQLARLFNIPPDNVQITQVQ